MNARAHASTPAAASGSPVLVADAIVREFDGSRALDGVSMRIRPGEIHALLGPNGAGKTTLLRIAAGLMEATSGETRISGRDVDASRATRRSIGLVPSGDRTFYLRLSGVENLIFFGRLHGLRLRSARQRAHEVLEFVDLTASAKKRVGEYSHGMQKRLSVARALLTQPALMLVDEATHDLDPHGARLVRDLVAGLARRGVAVAWATQRLEEIRGFADSVTVLDAGRVRFSGTVPELIAQTDSRSYLVWLQNGSEALAAEALVGAVGRHAALRETRDPGHFLLTLAPGAVLGDVFAALAAEDVQILSCREARSEIEEAFLQLTGRVA